MIQLTYLGREDQARQCSADRIAAMAAAQLPQTVLECHAVIAQLLERVKLLEERVNLDSNNSSKPPSSQRARQAQPGPAPCWRA